MAAQSLEAIYKYTHIPFNLILIDCNTPSKYLSQIKKVIENKPNVTIIHSDTYLQPNQSRNLVLANTKDEYVAFIENDCFVSDGWLSKLIAACEEYPAMVAMPLLFDGASWRRKVHHDRNIVNIRSWKEGGKTYYEFIPNLGISKRYKEKNRERVWSIETHFMFFRRKVFDVIGPFDECLNTREPVDISLALYRANIPIVFEPTARVNFYNPPPVYKDELPFYNFVWDLKRGATSNEYLAKKWNIVNMHASLDFMEDQHYRTGLLKWFFRKAPGALSRIAKKGFQKITPF